MLFTKTINDLKRSKEKLEEKIERKQDYLDTTVYLPSRIREALENRLDILEKKLDRINKKITVQEFKKIKIPKNKESKEYFKYIIAYEENEIIKIESKKPSHVNAVNKLREHNIKEHKAKIARAKIKVRDYDKNIKKIKTDVKSLPDAKAINTALTKDITKIKENKEKLKNPEDSKQSDSKNTEKQVLEKQVLEKSEKQVLEKSENTEKSILKKSKTPILENPENPGTEEAKENKPFNPLVDQSKLGQPKNNKPEKISLLNVTSDDLSNLNTLDLTKLDTLVGVHKKILEKLTQIEKNMIDEQDTSIKASSVHQNDTPIQVSNVSNKKGEDTGIGFGLIAGIVAMYLKRKLARLVGALLKPFKDFFSKRLKDIKGFFGKKLESIKNLFSKKLESIKNLFKPLTDKVSNLKKLISNKAKNLYDTGKKKVSNIIGKGKNLAKNLYDTGKKKVSNIIGRGKNLAKNLYDTDKKKVSNIIGKGKNLFSKGKNLVSKSMSKAIKSGEEVLSGAKNKLVKFGKGVITKLSTKMSKDILSKTMPQITKLIGKKTLTALTSVMKKVPGVSLLLGSAFAAKDFYNGDYAKGAVALLSGIAGTVPGAGIILGPALAMGGDYLIDKYNSKNKKPKHPKTKKVSKKLSDEPTYEERIKKAVKLGEGDTSNAYFNRGPEKNVDIIYKYDKSQQFIWTEDDIIKKGLDKKEGKSIDIDPKLIPKDKEHFNPLYINEVLQVQSSKINRTSNIDLLKNLLAKDNTKESLNKIPNATPINTSKVARPPKAHRPEKTSREAYKDKLKNALHLGHGDTSDIYLGVGPKKDLDIVYSYNKNQSFVWTEKDLIQKAQDLKNGKEINTGTSYIPKDDDHKNRSNTKKTIPVELTKERKTLNKEQQIQNITNLTPANNTTPMTSSQTNVMVNQGSQQAPDNAVRLAETFTPLNRF